MRWVQCVGVACSLLVVTLCSAIGGNQIVRGAHAPAPSITFTRLWVRSLSPIADSVAASLKSGNRTTLFVLAGNNGSNCSPGDPVRRATLYALDAGNGHVRWSRSTSGPSRCTTAAPVARGTWVYASGLDGKVHRYTTRSAQEDRSGGWPEVITLMPDVEKMSANLTITGNYLYATTSGFIGDAGHYEGHLVTIDLATGKRHIFNSLCSNVRTLLGPVRGRPNFCGDVQSGLFGRGQGVTDPVSHDVYIVSGNGPWNGHTNWGDSLLRLDPTGARLLDSYTPPNQADLNAQDADLGSTGPALLPSITRGRHTYHLLVQGGKGPACHTCNGAGLHLLNRDNLSGKGGPGHLGGDLDSATAPGGCEVLTAPVVWKRGRSVGAIYTNNCGSASYSVTRSGGRFHLQRDWAISTAGTTPVLAHGVLYVANDSVIHALDPVTGHELGRVDGLGGTHWQYPLIVGSHLYMVDQNGRLTAFAIHTTR